MASLPSVSAAVVQAVAGPRLYQRAAADLDAGRLTERLAYRNGVLSAMWDHRGQSAAPSLEFRGSQMAFDCSCSTFDERGMCVHCAGLVLAWATDPQTFARVDQDFDLDLPFQALFEDDFEEFAEDGEDDELAEVVDLLEMAATGRRVAAPTPAPAPGGPAPRAGTTLTTQWPDLTEAYAAELDELTVPQLRALAERRGVALSGTKREPLVQTLAGALGSVPALRQAWASLSVPARLVAGVQPFVEADYGASPVHLRQLLQAVKGKLGGEINAALEELQAAGLLFLNRAKHYSAGGSMLFFLPPDEVLLPPLSDTRGLRVVAAPPPLAFGQLSLRLLLALKADDARFDSRPLSIPHPLAAQAPELRGWPAVPAELEAAGQARSIYQALNQHPLTVPPAPSLLSEAALAELARVLAASPEQADFALRLLVKLGLVNWAPGEPFQVREDGFTQYLALTPAQHVAPLYNAFISLNDWTELYLALAATPGLSLKRQMRYGITYSSLLANLESARFHFLQLLRRAPAGQWIAVDQLVARARALNLLHAFWPLPAGVYLEQAGRSLANDTPENWRAYYRPYAEALLAGPLHWQGLVDLAYRQDELAAVRLTELGAFALYQTDTFSPPPAEPAGAALQFGADGSLLAAPGAAGPQLLSTLSLLGEARAGPEGTLRYRVTPAGAMRAFQAGWEAEPLLETLAEAAGQPVPEALAGALREWWAHFGDVHLYSGVALMELADDYALAELLSSTSLAQYLLFRFSPRVIALRPEGVEALRVELIGRGYTPKVAGGEA